MESELDTSVFEYSQMANVVSSGSFSISSSVLKWFGGGRIYYLHPNGLMLMGSFALGFLMCLVSLFGLLLATLYVLPYYVWPLERLGQGQAGWRWPLSLSRKPLLITPSTNTTTTTTTNPSSSSPLLRRGWIRVSHTPLTVAELYSSSSAGVSSSSSSSQLDSPSSTSSSDDDNDDDRIDQTWSPSSLLRRRHRRKSSEKSTSSPSSPNVINATSGNTRQLGMVEKTLEGTVSVLSSIYQSFNNQQTLSLALSGSGGGEASSATSSTQPRLRLVDSKPYRILYAELNPNNNGTDSKMLTLYSSDQPDADIVEIIQISNYKVALSPRDLPDFDLFLRDNPIHLKLRPEFRRHRHLRRHTINNDHLDDDLEPNYYIYAPSSLEKEDWYLSLQKIAKRSSISSSSVPFGSGADGFFIDTGNNYLHNHHHSDSSSPCCQIPLQTLNAIDEQHSCSMKKLVDTVNSSSIETAWLNALLGRAFVGINANPRIKEYIIHRFARRTMQQQQNKIPSFLGEITIQDVQVGDSIPILSNPKLLELSADGSLSIEMDIEYTGGASVQIATLATLNMPSMSSLSSSFNYFKFKPLSVPLVLGVSIKTFAARVLVKMKPFFESNRIWFGFYPDPEIKLELDIEPIISNKGVKLDIVNQVIEKRVKEALEEFLVLPKMEDVPFWSSEGMGGLFCCSNDEESITGESFSSNSRGGSVDATAVAVAAISATTSSAEDSFKHTPSVVKSASLEPLVSDSMRASRDNLTANDGEEGPIAVVEKNKQRGARTSLESSRTPTTAVTTTAVKADTESSTTLNSSDQQQLRKFVALKRGESLPTTPTPTAASTSGVSSTIDYLSKTAITYGLDDRAKQLLSKAQEYGLDKSAESLIGKAKEYGLDGRMKYISNWIEKAGILPSHQIKPVVVEPTTASDATSTTTPTPPLSIMPPSSGGDLLELDVAIISKHSSGSSPIMAATTGNYQQITSSTTKSCEIAAKVLDEILDDALTLLVSSKTVDELPVESVEKAGEVKIDRMADIDDSSHRADKGTQTPPPHLDTTEVVVSNGDGTGKMGAFELKERLLTSFAEELLVRYSPNDSAAATVAATTVAFESTSHHLAHEDDNNSSLLNLQGSGSLSSTGLLLLEDHTSENDLSAMEPMLMMEDVFEQVEEDVYVIQNNISDRDDIGLYNNPLRRQVIPTVHHHHAGDEWINSSTSLSIAGDDGLYSESGYKKEEDEEEGDAEDMELDVINIKSTIVPTTLATTTPILPASHEGEIKPSSTSLLSTKGAVSAITSLTGFSSLLSYQQSLRNVFNDISHIVNNPTPQLRLVNPAALESEEELDGETVPALVVASSSNSTTPSSSLHSSPERRY